MSGEQVRRQTATRLLASKKSLARILVRDDGCKIGTHIFIPILHLSSGRKIRTRVVYNETANKCDAQSGHMHSCLQSRSPV